MDLTFKEDFEQTQKRFATWWAREEMEGPLLGVYAPRRKKLTNRPEPPPPTSVEQRWFDIDYRIAVAEYRMATTYYAGDTFPHFELALGPGSLALHLGSIPGPAETTFWYHPAFDDIAAAPEPRFDPDEHHWKLTLRMAEQALAHFKGRALISFPDLIENLDILASLRGTMGLLHDLVDHPEHVHRFQRAIVERFFDCYDRLEKMIRDVDGGTCYMAFHIWGRGRTCKLQSDISAMLSREMFDDFAMPYFFEQCRRLDNTLYHLDGPHAIKHLESLCQLPLNAIQWMPGAGAPIAADPSWTPLLRRILAAGKGLQILYAPIELVQSVVEAVGPRGLMIQTRAKTQEQADELVRQSKMWKKRG